MPLVYNSFSPFWFIFYYSYLFLPLLVHTVLLYFIFFLMSIILTISSSLYYLHSFSICVGLDAAGRSARYLRVHRGNSHYTGYIQLHLRLLEDSSTVLSCPVLSLFSSPPYSSILYSPILSCPLLSCPLLSSTLLSSTFLSSLSFLRTLLSSLFSSHPFYPLFTSLLSPPFSHLSTLISSILSSTPFSSPFLSLSSLLPSSSLSCKYCTANYFFWITVRR